MFKITEVRVKKINKGKLLGYASILIDKCFIVDGIALLDGEKGRYILMPINTKIKKVRRYNAFPINEDTRKLIFDAISQKYDELEE